MILGYIRIPVIFLRQRLLVRCLSTPSDFQHVPWFVYREQPGYPLEVRRTGRPPRERPATSLPEDTPDHLRKLYYELSVSPYLDTSCLAITRPTEPIPGPPLPSIRPKGRRRRRGGTTDGIGIDVPSNGLWNWFVFAQIKEGTETKGSIARVVKIIRKLLGQLAASNPGVVMPPKGRNPVTDGWDMLDVGDFAVHIISRDAREKWFPTTIEP